MGTNIIKMIDGKYDTDTDIMRIIAAFFIVMIHCSGLSTLSGLVYNSVSRFSVPVFVMISGYYMLWHKVPLNRLLQKSGKLFLLMIVWSGIYFGYFLLTGGIHFTGAADLVRYLLTQPIHLWYLYAAIALYLLTPILYVFCTNATRQEYRYALLFAFLFGSVVKILLNSMWFPTLSAIIDKMKVPDTLGFVFLYLAGGYLRKYELSKPSESARLLYLLAAAGTIATVVGTYELSGRTQRADLMLSFFSPNVILAGIGFFVLVKRSYRCHPIKSRRLRAAIHVIAGCTLGIYLLHPLIILLLPKTMENVFVGMRPALSIPFKTITVFCISALLIAGLKKLISITSLIKSSV